MNSTKLQLIAGLSRARSEPILTSVLPGISSKVLGIAATGNPPRGVQSGGWRTGIQLAGLRNLKRPKLFQAYF